MLSAVIIAKNEEHTIKRAIQSVLFADEVIMVDDDSTDQTAIKAAEAGATILTHDLNDDFAAQRNYALEKVRGDWVLYIDADEVVSKELQDEIIAQMERTTDIQAFRISRHDYFWGNKLTKGELWRASHKGIVRLVRRESGTWKGRVHEEFVTTQKTSQLINPLFHYPHQSISEFLRDINRYSSLRAEELYTHGAQISILAIMTIPFCKFIYTYFFKLGLLDGPAGFVYSFMMSFHSFLVRAKLYVKTDDHTP